MHILLVVTSQSATDGVCPGSDQSDFLSTQEQLKNIPWGGSRAGLTSCPKAW